MKRGQRTADAETNANSKDAPLDSFMVLSDNQQIRASCASESVVDCGEIGGVAALGEPMQRRAEFSGPEEIDLFSRTAIGLRTGDLKPLAEYLRSPYPLHPSIALELARCIDSPDAFYRLKKYRKGPGDWDQSVENRQQIARIGHFIDLHNEGKRGDVGDAQVLAAETFDLSLERIEQVWKQYLRYRREGRIQNGLWMGRLGASGARSIRSGS